MPDTVVVKFNGEFVYGGSVIREKPLKIYNVPKNNVHAIPENRLIDSNFSIDVYHGGFWLLIRQERSRQVITFYISKHNRLIMKSKQIF